MQSNLYLENIGMVIENKITYYKIKRNYKGKNGKKLSYTNIRFVNKETGERKDIRLGKLRREIGDTKRFMPSNALEIDIIVKKAIEMGVAPFSDGIKQNDTRKQAAVLALKTVCFTTIMPWQTVSGLGNEK